MRLLPAARRAGRGHRRRFPVGVRAAAGVRFHRSGAGLFRPRAEPGRGDRAAAAPAWRRRFTSTARGAAAFARRRPTRSRPRWPRSSGAGCRSRRSTRRRRRWRPAACRRKSPHRPRSCWSRPDKASPAWKAFERALALTRQTPERLLLALGAFDSPRSLHVARFGAEYFPHGFDAVACDDDARRCRGAHRRAAAGRGRGVLDRRFDHHRDRRLPVGAIAAGRALARRRAHRGPGAGDHRRARARRAGARAHVDDLHARRQDHDAARRGDRGVFARCRARGAGAVAVRRPGCAGRAHRVALLARRAGPGRRQPASRPARRRVRRGGARRGDAGRRGADQPSARRCAARAVAPDAGAGGRTRARARQARAALQVRLQLLHRSQRRRRARAHRAASPRCAARPHRRRDDDPRQQRVGAHAGRSRRARRVPVPAGREGEDRHAPAAAPGAGRVRSTCGPRRRCAAISTW